jgi:chromosome partitioning protein
MGKVLAFTNSKGGVGKSTLSVHMAVHLREQGRKVVLVDADVQGSSSKWIHEASPETDQLRLQTPDDLLEQIPALREQFEFLVIDGPAGLSEVTRAALFVSDATFLPCGPSALDLWAAGEAVRVVRQAQTIRKGPPAAFLIPNKLQVRHRLSRELLETGRSLGIPVTPGLRLLQAYADAAGQGRVVWHMGSDAAPAAQEMKTLLEVLLHDESKEIIEPGVAERRFAVGSTGGYRGGEGAANPGAELTLAER